MPESSLYGPIMVAATVDCHARLFRNNSGALRDERGVLVRFGLTPGASDLIGIVPRRVTPEMVGTVVGLFTALEVKRLGRSATTQQAAFLAMVLRNGGIAARVTSVEEAIMVIRGEP